MKLLRDHHLIFQESERESVEREIIQNDTASLILNVSGKLVLVQRERTATGISFKITGFVF